MISWVLLSLFWAEKTYQLESKDARKVWQEISNEMTDLTDYNLVFKINWVYKKVEIVVTITFFSWSFQRQFLICWLVWIGSFTFQIVLFQQYFPLILFIMLHKVVLSFWARRWYPKVWSMKVTEQHFPVVLFCMMYNIIHTGFIRVLEIPESTWILVYHFPGLESPWKS